jgi:translation initiation factor IF-2
MRVHELATELSMNSKDVVLACHGLEIPVKNHMSVLDEAEADRVRAALTTAAEVTPIVPAEADAPGGEQSPAADAATEPPVAKEDDEDEDRQPTEEEERLGRRVFANGRRGGKNLSQEDPYWQFGTPVESWGSTRGNNGRDPSGLAPDDPYWQFGSPPETWGSSRKQGDKPHQTRPRVYIECTTCGVKIEKKRAHGDKKVKCPFCSRWMRLVK